MKVTDPAAVQAAQYRYPYHHLPHESGGVWHVGRHVQWGFEYLSLLAAVAEEVEKREPSSVLDFGCGDGRLLAELSRRMPPSTRLCGVDLDERALLFARGFNSERVRFASRLDELEGSRFDVLTASEVLEHIPPDECARVIPRLVELLEPAGVVVVTVPTHNLPVPSKHFRHFDLKELNDSLAPHLVPAESRYLHHVGFRSKLVRGLAANRLFLANWAPWLKALGLVFRKWVEPADASSGARLLAIYTRP